MPNKIDYISYGNTVDGASYCTEIETLAENILEKNNQESSITFPSKDGMISPRNDTDYLLTTENVQIVLPSNIYRVKKAFVQALKNIEASLTYSNLLTIGDNTYPFLGNIGSIDAEYIYYQNGDNADTEVRLIDKIFECTELVLTKEEHMSLPTHEAFDDVINSEKNTRSNTLYYIQGDNKIFLGEQGKGFLGGSGKKPYPAFITRVLTLNGYDRSKLYVYTKTNNVGLPVACPKNEGTGRYSARLASIISYGDVRDSAFRVEYVPLAEKVKIKAHKNNKLNVEYAQAYNQRAEYCSASALGKNMFLTAQKTGVKTVSVVKRYKQINDIPNVGSKVYHNGKMYRISANSYSMTNTAYIQVTHTLSENWTMRSNHIAVDQKYRNWKIPQDVLWRTLYCENFLHLAKTTGTQPSNQDGFIDFPLISCMFDSTKTKPNPISQMYWEDADVELNIKVVVPCEAYAVGNSMVFSSTFQDNVSAGLNRTKVDENTFCDDVFYCHANGTLETARIRFAENIGNADSNKYPAYDDSKNTPVNVHFDKTFTIKKDAGEALKFTYQIHIVADYEEIVVGTQFAGKSPIVSQWDTAEDLTLFLSKNPLRYGDDIITPTENTYGLKMGKEFGIKGGRIYLLGSVENAKNDGVVAWGICTKNKELIFGCNDINTNSIDIWISKYK